jgi:hypothetical protein
LRCRHKPGHPVALVCTPHTHTHTRARARAHHTLTRTHMHTRACAPHTHTHAHAHAHAHAHTHTHTHTHTTHSHARTRTRTRAHAHTAQSTLPTADTSPHDCTFEVDVTFQGDACVDLRLDLLRGRQGSVTLRATELAGRMQIRMRSLPSPHYTASFVTAPLLTLHAKSLFEGREMPHFDTVLTHLIRRAVERNHTLPAAKIRYEPMFRPPPSFTEGPRSIVELAGRQIHEGKVKVWIRLAELYDGVSAMHPPRSVRHSLSHDHAHARTLLLLRALVPPPPTHPPPHTPTHTMYTHRTRHTRTHTQPLRFLGCAPGATRVQLLCHAAHARSRDSKDRERVDEGCEAAQHQNLQRGQLARVWSRSRQGRVRRRVCLVGLRKTRAVVWCGCWGGSTKDAVV